MKVILETERLLLREMTEEGSANLSSVLSNPESMKNYPHPLSNAEVISWIEKNIERYREYGYGLWAVIRKSDLAFLGDCGITMQNIDGELLPEIGFHIIKEYCNNGYATEAASACRDYAADVLNFKSVYSYSRHSNVESQRVSQKIGMKEIKRYQNNGIETVVYEYRVL